MGTTIKVSSAAVLLMGLQLMTTGTALANVKAGTNMEMEWQGMTTTPVAAMATPTWRFATVAQAQDPEVPPGDPKRTGNAGPR